MSRKTSCRDRRRRLRYNSPQRFLFFKRERFEMHFYIHYEIGRRVRAELKNVCIAM